MTNTEVDIRESLNWTNIKDHHDVLRMIPDKDNFAILALTHEKAKSDGLK